MTERPWVVLTCRGVRIPTLIDTGAACTIIRTDFLRKLKTQKLYSEDSERKVLTANGGTLDIQGQTYIPIDGCCEVRVRIASGDLSVPLILGSDAVKRGNANIDVESATLRWCGKEYKLGEFSLPEINIIDHLAEVTEIPAAKDERCQQILCEYEDVFQDIWTKCTRNGTTHSWATYLTEAIWNRIETT